MNVKVEVFPRKSLMKPYTVLLDADSVSFGAIHWDWYADIFETGPFSVFTGAKFLGDGLTPNNKDEAIENGYEHEMTLIKGHEETYYMLQDCHVFVMNDTGKTVEIFKTFK